MRAFLASSVSIPNFGVNPKIAQATSSPAVILFDLRPMTEFAKTTELDSAQATFSPAFGKLHTWYWTHVQHWIPPSFAYASQSRSCCRAYSSGIPKSFQLTRSMLAGSTVVGTANLDPDFANFSKTSIPASWRDE